MNITITGENDFARSAEIRSIRAVYLQEHDAFGIEVLDGEVATVEQMRSAVESMPFLTSRKLVILHSPSKQKAFSDALMDVLSAVSDVTDLVIVEPKLDKRTAYYKTLKKETDFREYSELDVQGLARWAISYAKERGGGISSGDAIYLIDRVGLGQQTLSNELDKLVAYNPTITKDAITELTERMPQSTIFELLDAAFAGNTARALELYQEQRSLKVEPQAIIALMGWQLHILSLVKAGSKKQPADLAKEAKLNPFVVRKSQGMVRSLSLATLKKQVEDLLRLDIRLKRSSIDPDEATKLFIVKLGQK